MGGMVCAWDGLCVGWSVRGMVCVWGGLCMGWYVCGMISMWDGLCACVCNCSDDK